MSELFAVEVYDAARVRLYRARNYLDERRFARSVLSEQGVNLALLEFERYVVERHHAWIGLAYVLQLQHGRTLLSAYSAGVKVPDASSTVTTASPVALSMKLQRPG